MIIVTTVEEVRQVVRDWKEKGLSIGLVPTMGFLHQGHASLIKRSATKNHRTVVSIFVNPLQFSEKQDLETYPRDLEKDSRICEEAGANLVFVPSVETMYPDPFLTQVNTAVLTEVLCGKSRPNHFQGVCTVVSKLFHIVTPTRAYFGKKDAQQLAVIQKMTQDLDFHIEIVGCPTVREANGLAKSSRNIHLSDAEREKASVIYKSLTVASAAIQEGERDPKVLRKMLTEMLEAEPLLTVDYIEILSWPTLEPMEEVEKPTLIAIAANCNKVRLIDNFLWE